MTQQLEGSNDAAKSAVCPLHCHSGNGSNQLEWAGLPVNLDLAFSQNQREKVLAQHQVLRRGALLRSRLRDCAPVCVCDDVDDSGSNP
ncbi:hypothetical protein [Mycobacterium asiaticum]|uniref:hypothetical protein n=1 Tax=Mycobacterium asiaticum TaxID=1790 RepID=UPI0009C12B71|nr:hypothetical protein [Mycobacterium asiaticum]